MPKNALVVREVPTNLSQRVLLDHSRKLLKTKQLDGKNFKRPGMLGSNGRLSMVMPSTKQLFACEQGFNA